MQPGTAATEVPGGLALRLACPACRGALRLTADQAHCESCGVDYACTGGVWHLLRPDRWAAFAQFEREYHTVRRAEGWGNDDPAYYRALPWQDLSGRHADLWRIRATSFRALLERVLPPLEAQRRPLRILDLGAGNGWLAYRLAQRGHALAAIDISDNARDGLGAWRHYDAGFVPLRAEFDALPLEDAQADLAIFNASLHYSTDYTLSLAEALRVLRPDGRLVILDSPVYRDPTSGVRMVHEREAQFLAEHGFPSNALPSENFLTPDRLDSLEKTLGVRWSSITPFYGLAWHLRPWRARLRGHREPATFCVIVGVRR